MNALPESTHRLFTEPKDVTVITLDPDGSPQASMVWAERDGDQLLIGIEPKHRKTRNLQRDPRVTLVVQDDRRSPRGLTQYLVIRGTATLEGPGIPQEYKALMDKQSLRYLGKPDFPYGDGVFANHMIARITVDRVLGEGPWTA
ncbi:PPOX class probable F420-dependent enzyme [Kribbella antiqua]|uniref:PPOX class probable F420-dependent enzyme n=1 Tax=Kribbella antiqua TaxID=2512217 RepID=A0A4R2IZ69_9ACTN|nr:TIGR03618 family F420-dependent PPOX class oxidoreductase [Kribbella antiqua]TCO49239.1 PPOX class probable F420-dependent enzyme [Kribbella antiqua]